MEIISKFQNIKTLVLFVSLFAFSEMNAQITYTSAGKLLFGNGAPHPSYNMTICGTGVYFKCSSSNFFQIDVSPLATRLASHNDQVVFYNTQTDTWNDIQVGSVLNHSDARDKVNVTLLENCLPNLLKLKAYSYNFADGTASRSEKYVRGGNGKDYGLLAQELEEVYPELVMTDPDGRKLVNYIEIIPLLINSVQQLSAEVERLKAVVGSK